MAKGIITVKPGSGGAGGTKGRIMVTEGSSGGTGDGTGGTVSGSISGGLSGSGTVVAGTTIAPGTYVDFTESTTANVGDVVEFNTDGTIASGINPKQTGTLYSGTITDNINVGAGESAVVSGANFDGKITVSGGFLVVINATKAEGKIESTTAGSFVFVDGCTHEGKIEVTGAGTLVIQNSTIEGKVSAVGNTFSSVTNCIIKGKLEIANASDCFTCKNTVEGNTSVPSTCRKCS
jgi:hypothetical protein